MIYPRTLELRFLEQHNVLNNSLLDFGISSIAIEVSEVCWGHSFLSTPVTDLTSSSFAAVPHSTSISVFALAVEHPTQWGVFGSRSSLVCGITRLQLQQRFMVSPSWGLSSHQR